MGMEGLQDLVTPVIRRLLIGAGILIAVCIVAIALLSGCAGRYDDNPRNMRNMTADQIERALAERE